jgi:hypothetical protein
MEYKTESAGMRLGEKCEWLISTALELTRKCLIIVAE